MVPATLNLKDKFNRTISTAYHDNNSTDDFPYATCSANSIPDIKFATDCFVSMVDGVYDFYGLLLCKIKLNYMVF